MRLTTATGKKLLKEYREGHLTNLSVQDRAKVDAFLAGQSAARTVVPTRPATTVTTPVAQSENADTWPLPATVVDKMSMNEMETVLRRHGIRIALPRDKASRRALFARKRCDVADRRLVCDAETEICDLRNQLCRTMAELRKRQRPFGIREVRHGNRLFWGDETMVAPLSRLSTAAVEQQEEQRSRPDIHDTPPSPSATASPAARIDDAARRRYVERLFSQDA